MMPNIKRIENLSNNDDSQNQIQRDRKMRENRKRSNDKYRSIKSKQLCKIKLAKFIVNDLKNYGPGNLIHVNALSTMTGKSIRIWRSKDSLYQTVDDPTNQKLSKDFIDIEYHKQSNLIGHWTLLNNIDPINVELDLNACLFAVIAAQSGESTDDLRNNTIDFLTNNSKHLIDQIDKFLSSNNNAKQLMIGGARYIGTSPRAAGIILDKSQNVLCHDCRALGHPRGHASDRFATGPEDSVENYSRTTRSRKSGFLSRTDQDNVAHLVLSHAKARQAMEKLNTGATSIAVELSRRDLQINHFILPQMKEFYNGTANSEELNINCVIIVLRHHIGKYRDPNADVFVHTFYPKKDC
ncbi:uncharacterized protein LOC126921290 [Bombus affinis]|uniref:uncharacterized protein LOC126921290 n=1 Tax=Bombus affinis TaxID=309941 RepID=UPI0021B776F1|nr:uncharacterized protein LOC126921290 [Bombus affinis]